MDQEEGISTEEQADDETVSKSQEREATIAAIKQVILKTAAERPDLEQAQIPCKHQNIEKPQVDPCIENGGDQQVARKRSC